MKYPYLSEKKCKNCNGDIFIKRSRDKNNVFCGPACVGRFKKNNESVDCKYCGNPFKKSSKTKNLFCSKDCANKSRKVEYKRNCEFCDKEFTLKNIAEINRGGGGYCSNSCSSRKYKLDEYFFEDINTQEKAYILGFIYADGCVSKRGYELIIKLNKKDRIILEEIKNILKSQQPIDDIDKINQCSLRISSKKTCEYLLKWGVMPNKTFKIKFPEIDNSMIRHFIRGYFDGDGCISKIKNRNSDLITIFTASNEFMESLVSHLTKFGIKSNTYTRESGFAISFSSKESVSKFRDLIYTDSTILLERKKLKFPI
jgi:hypothetical protein